MTKTAIRIRENNDNNIELLFRNLLYLLSMRGISFIHHETKNGLELFVFLPKARLLNLISEANEYCVISLPNCSDLEDLVNDETHSVEVEIEYNIGVVVKSHTNIEL